MAVPLLNTRLDAEQIAAAANGHERPAAIVCNAHITGLAVARSLARRGVPVIGLDREPHGVALASNALVAAAVCHDPISRESDFIQDMLAIGKHLDQPAVLFGCMDEWVLALSAHRAELEGAFAFPFAADEVVRRILDKSVLYRGASLAGIPIPRYLDTRAADDERVLAEIGVPCILKPAAKRPFYDAFGANLFVVETADDYRRRRQEGDRFGMIAQEILPATHEDYFTVGAALVADGRALGAFVGQRLEISPPGYGTTCLARGVQQPELEEHAVAILRRLGYHGIAEVEFLRDPRDGTFKLLDVNTRPWKWVGLPIASGVDLPWLVYAEATGLPVGPVTRRDDVIWVSLKDYIPLRARGEAMQPVDPIDRERWLCLIAGDLRGDITAAVFDPTDPEPFHRVLETAFGLRQYSCPC
ncbi:MAG: carboxylate--amine ligase [Thermomicrobiales bacterium]